MAEGPVPDSAPAADPAGAPVSPLVVALGEETFEVVHVDGRRELVGIRLLPIAEFADYLAALETEETHAEFAAKRPPGWAATLRPDSLLELLDRSLRLNFPSVRRWAEYRTKVLALADALRLTPRSGSSPSPRR